MVNKNPTELQQQTRATRSFRGVAAFFLGVLCTTTASGMGRFFRSTVTPLNDYSFVDYSATLRVDPLSGANNYIPASTEAYVVDHAVALGLGSTHDPSGCDLWRHFGDDDDTDQATADVIPDEVREKFGLYLEELKEYNRRVAKFSLKGRNFTDLRQGLRYQNHSMICPIVDLPLRTIFSDLSYVPLTGYVEPLLPPLRHPQFCLDDLTAKPWPHLMDLTYMVHDFGAMCRQLTPYSRTVLIDMGASLSFHKGHVVTPPEVYLTGLFKKFGITFDHVYAYEIKPHNTTTVFEQLIPEDLQAAYHWINVGVDWKPGARMNPFTMLKQNYGAEDLIVVKLDVDTASTELPLAKQLLNDKHLQSLIDHFYFEHHVHMKELAKNWKSSMQGTMQESLQLFYQLRQTGIAAHYWV
jgi:hypothetical protein